MDRRDALHLLGASALGVAAGPAVAAPAATADSMTPAEWRAAYRRLRYRMDDGLVFWWMQGTKIGQVGTTLTPLYEQVFGIVQRVRHRPDGSFAATTLEMGVMLDLETRAPLERWRNPYTGEMLTAPARVVGPTTVRVGADNARELPKEVGGAPLEATDRTWRPVVVGDDVFFTDEAVARVHTPGRTSPFEVNDLSTYHGRLSELRDPAVASASATVFFAEVTGWQRWMNMGDRPGGLTSRTAGRKVRSYAQLPEQWRAVLARRSPRIAADPVAALDGPQATFDR